MSFGLHAFDRYEACACVRACVAVPPCRFFTFFFYLQTALSNGLYHGSNPFHISIHIFDFIFYSFTSM